jgi:N-acetylglucosamine-6-phosphate deacetylase
MTRVLELVRQYPGVVKTITLAPEIPGADELISGLISRGIRVSAGHTGATLDEAQRGFDKGINRISHLFNAMPPIHHREPGIITAALLDERVFVELIPDGIHVNSRVLKLVVRAKQADRICLISDAMMAAGLGDGSYHLGRLDVMVRDNAARLSSGALAGSIIGMDQGVRNMVELADCSLPQAVAMASCNPALALGVDKITGSLEPGKQADIVVLNQQLQVVMTMIQGKVVYEI